MAKRKRKATLHSTGKSIEADLLERAEALADDPSLATPIYEGGFVLFNPVTGAAAGIKRAHAARDDEVKLIRLASWGNDLTRAYAATLLVAKAKEIPFVADLRLPMGRVPYVVRGAAKAFFLAGLQHHHDRELRLLAVTPWVKKRKLYFYSADRGIVCTGKKPAPPADFVREEAELLGFDLVSEGHYACGHESERDLVRLLWKSVRTTFERCAVCAADASTIHEILRHVAAPRPARDFEATVALRHLSVASGEPPAEAFALPEPVVREYLAGRVNDRALIEAGRAARVAALRATRSRLFVAGDVSYGSDMATFLKALAPSEVESRALRAALAEHEGPIVLDKATSARALAELWSEHGARMLEAAAGDPDVAKRLHKLVVTPDEAADLIRRAAREGTRGLVTSVLPSYGFLPPVAAAADAIARRYRGDGTQAAVRVALEQGAGAHGKAVALAALTRLNAAQVQQWRFSQVDREVAVTLAAPMERLLNGEPAKYHEALTLTSQLCGETASFEPVSK